MKGYRKYFGKKILWFALTFVVAVVLNFVLPRLMPADPVAGIMSKMGTMTDASAVAKMYEYYAEQFGVNKPLWEQFLIFCKNAVRGDFGLSFSQYPRSVSDIISSSIVWTIALQFPAIITGWILGNVLGALAAYLRKGWDKVLMPVSLFLSNIPAFGMAVIMLVIFAVNLKIAPIGGGYNFDMIPNLSWGFVKSVIHHYQLPFWSIVLISIGGDGTILLISRPTLINGCAGNDGVENHFAPPLSLAKIPYQLRSHRPWLLMPACRWVPS